MRSMVEGAGQRLRLCREPHAAGADQPGKGRLEAPERAARRAHEIDELVVGAAEREVGGREIAVRDRHETDNETAWIDLEDAAEPGGGHPQIAFDVVMKAVGAA